MPQHAKSRQAFARSSDRMVPEDFLLGDETRAVWESVRTHQDDATLKLRWKLVAAGPAGGILYRFTRSAGRSDPLELIARVFVWMAHAKWPEARLRIVLTYLDDLITRLYAGSGGRGWEELDLEEQRIDAREDILQMERRCARAVGRPLSPLVLREEAQVLRSLSAISQERARMLEREARLTESGIQLAAGGVLS
ncbi:MAG: hypothetical protein JWO05_1124 [Gemmatimonadetes bacterium]|nr:hypothetical protein [Gemmatimonadota bacterium]